MKIVGNRLGWLWLCKGLHCLGLFLFLCVAQGAQRPSVIDVSRLQSALDDLVFAHGQDALSVQIWDLSSDQSIYQFHPDRVQTLASTQKLITAALAWQTLGPLDSFQTRLVAEGRAKKETWLGSLTLELSGDPTLSTYDLESFIQTLKQKNIKTITGPFIIAMGIELMPGLGPGWMWDERKDCYAAPYSPATLDHNCFVVTLMGHRVGQPPTMQVHAPEQANAVRHSVVVVDDPSPGCDLKVAPSDDRTYLLQGCVASGQQKTIQLAVQDPVARLKEKLTRLFEVHGITVTQGVRVYEGPTSIKKAQWVVEHRSPTVDQLIVKMLRDSDNLIAESLLQRVVQKKGDKGWGGAERVLQAYVAQRVMHPDGLHLVDGSGLSRYNGATVNQLVDLLRTVWKNPADQPLLQSMNHYTLNQGQRQMTERDLAPIWAKTGSMTGVSSFAGVMLQCAHPVAFAIAAMGASHAKQFHATEDAILTTLQAYCQVPVPDA